MKLQRGNKLIKKKINFLFKKKGFSKNNYKKEYKKYTTKKAIFKKMIFENSPSTLSEDNFIKDNFHLNSLTNDDNISLSEIPGISYIVTPLNEKNSSSNNKPFFIVSKKTKRGRKIYNNNFRTQRKTHTSNFLDNTLCKLQIHFLNFLVNFSNDAIRTAFPKEQKNRKDKKSLKLKKIEHGIKRDIKEDTLKILMKNPINYILKKKISNKYWKLSKNPDYNEHIYSRVIQTSEWLNNLFNMNYLELFEKYFNQCKPLDSIYFEGRTIIFSKETKPFYSLYNELNIEMKEKIIHLIKDLYLGKNLLSLKFHECSISK